MATKSISKRFHHGLFEHPLYDTWRRMRQRCNTKTHAHYKNYGGRGISVCKRWDNFANFLSDMGDKPSKDYSLERVDNNGDYRPENCTWATSEQQCNNSRFNRFLTYQGETMSVSRWARKAGMKENTLLYRLRLGWSVDDAISRPVQKHVRSVQ